MISWENLYDVLSNVVPLYVVMILAYSSVKWWKIFTPNECLGVNKFVALFAAPFLSIKFISNNNPYAMTYKFIAADTLQKVVVITILFLWCKLSSSGSLEWCITLFSLSTLTNTLIMGIPLLEGMYGESPSTSLMVQLSVIQFIIWNSCLLFMFEYRKATLLIPQKCCENEIVVNGDGSLGLDEEKRIGVDEASFRIDESSEINEVHQRGNENQTNNDHDHNHDHDHRGNVDAKVMILGSTQEEFGPRTTTADQVHPETTTVVQLEPESEETIPAGVATTTLILAMVCKKLIKNPNFFCSAIALVWSLISFRWHIQIPTIVANSITVLSNTGLGMAMFSLGLFMASQPRIIAGGNASAALAAVMRFLVGPAIMAATSNIVGLKGTLLKINIMQAALPQAIVPFIFAQEYNVHPGILSTAVSFGMLISLPITLVYYIVLGLIIK